MTTFKISLFKNKYDTTPQLVERSWQELCAKFQKPQVRFEKDGALFSPAMFEPDYRKKENVREVSLLCLDIDHDADFEHAKKCFDLLDCAFAVYSTHSHLRQTESNPNAEPRFRVVVPLVCPISAKDFPFLWQCVKQKTRMPFDENAKDSSRMFYTPVKAERHAPYQSFIKDGEFLDWREMPLDSFADGEQPYNAEKADGANQNGNGQNSDTKVFEFYEDRHTELTRRIEAQAKPTGRGGFEMKCPAHNGNGDSSLFYDTAKQSVACLKKPKCSYFEILAAFGLPDGKLPSREHREKLTFDNQPKPLDLTLKPVETIDDDCLPNVLVSWLRPASRVIGCPFDFLVLSAVVMIGSIIGSRLRVKPLQNSDWFVVPNLYGGIVGLPSTKKTPALDETRKPILELQAKASKEFSDTRKDFEIEAKYYERETTAIYREKLNLEATKAKIKALSEPNQPILKRYETNDITTPKLAQFLAENPNGLLQFRDELTGWFKSLEADYDTNARSLILELWKGAINYEKARVGDGEIQIPSGTLSIMGGIQPSKLLRYIAEAYSFDNSDGLSQRFLFAYPDTPKRGKKPTADDFEQMQNGYAAVNRLVKKIAEYDFNGKVIGASGDRFHIVKFSRDAQITADEWQNEIEDEAERLQIEDEAFSTYLYKLPKNCFAIALIFHCLENINRENFPDEISNVTTFKAIAYTDVLISHARRVFALGENQIFVLARTLLGKIKKGNLEQGFTAYNVKRKQWSGIKTPDTVKDVLELLVDYGYLRELQTEGEGRRTTKYFFHPSLESEIENENELEN